MVSVVRDKQPVAFTLFIHCANHAHYIPQLLAEMQQIERKLKPKQTQYILRRFGDVYGAQGINRLMDVGLISETERSSTLQDLMNAAQSKDKLKEDIERMEREGKEVLFDITDFEIKLCKCTPSIGLEETLRV
jgi:hypothetical protein